MQIEIKMYNLSDNEHICNYKINITKRNFNKLYCEMKKFHAVYSLNKERF